MILIALVGSKGGIGKTTTVVNIICPLAYKGYSVAAIDFDVEENPTLRAGSQKSLTGFFRDRMLSTYIQNPFYDDRLQIMEENPSNWSEILDELKEDSFDYIVADFGGGISEGMLSFLRHADCIIMPMKPEKNYISSLDNILTILKSRPKSRHPKCKITILPVELDFNQHRLESTYELISEEVNYSNRKEFYQLIPDVKMIRSKIIPDSFSRELAVFEWFNYGNTSKTASKSDITNYHAYSELFKFITGNDFVY